MTREERDNALKVLKNYDLNFHKINGMLFSAEEIANAFDMAIKVLEQEQKIGHCKNCKFFELNSWAVCGGIPIIVAHEICKAWGEGCKTKVDGYCFLFEPKESEDKE